VAAAATAETRLQHPAALVAASVAAAAVAGLAGVARRLWELAAVPAVTTALERALRASFALRASRAQSWT
jgi:hypothetical protein